MLIFMFGIVSSVISGIFVFLLTTQIKENNKKKNIQHNKNMVKELAINDAVLCLLRVKLIEYHDYYIKIGFVPSYIRDNWELMYQTYRNLGGNGMIEGMNIEFRKLPIVNELGG